MRADIKIHIDQLSGEHRKVARHFSGPGARDLEEVSGLLPSDEPVLLLAPGWVALRRDVTVGGYILLTGSRIIFWSPEGTIQNAPLTTVANISWSYHTAVKYLSILYFRSRGVDYSFVIGRSDISYNGRDMAAKFSRIISTIQLRG